MSIQNNLQAVLKQIDGRAKLVAVSKTKPNEDLMQAYEAGQRVLGENKVQELVGKYESLPKDIEWHMIGHLQSNKVKYIAPFVSLIHGVDTEKLLKTINKEGKKNNRKIACLLQVHIAQEQTKFGFSEEELLNLLTPLLLSELKYVELKGVMGMATFTNDTDQIRQEFKSLKNVFDKLKTQVFVNDSCFSEISMGMSGDYQLAIEEGSTMVRVGSSIFGVRNYH
ncbi:YggS family pyridoxal phosphate-dependent enzyme [Carboxylicivirga sp. M1479]|uniref:YggS family pyridoxal phosphate-dependent enzyme n=1 Tax=Carboxylicivirga sp. M1479 TaxID=2594476 RepID=UPI0011779672|nr:YggS family pyridoxal phosphate-dependent enzyme [Carboxylicivirga sp. M1479]TRX70654.1 YggS family pyridoxal phosphate-dependent enzyme [Carboxylicivirga sp. M1479]